MDDGAGSYRRFLAGDNEGLREIVCAYRTGLILYLNSFVQNIHTAEELAEDTFFELMKKRLYFREKARSGHGFMQSDAILRQNISESTQSSVLFRWNHRNTLPMRKASKQITSEMNGSARCIRRCTG